MYICTGSTMLCRPRSAQRCSCPPGQQQPPSRPAATGPSQQQSGSGSAAGQQTGTGTCGRAQTCATCATGRHWQQQTATGIVAGLAVGAAGAPPGGPLAGWTGTGATVARPQGLTGAAAGGCRHHPGAAVAAGESLSVLGGAVFTMGAALMVLRVQNKGKHSGSLCIAFVLQRGLCARLVSTQS